MNRPRRLGTALSTLAIAAVLSGCATGQQGRASIFGGRIDHENIGLATRAQAALMEGNFAAAVQLAERAVENTPSDAGFRALLGNCYFGAGRFASAEAAYLDSLSLIGGQPEVILKLALVQIALGKNAAALSALSAGRNILEPANYGLALALAGRPDDAVAVLNQVARMPTADAQVRQNLALAYGLSGNWTMARTVAAQDLPPGQIDGRMQKWMAMATPARPSDQVAALTGIKPAADPGMPQQLALHRAPANSQAYAYAVAPQSRPQVAPQVQQVADIPPAPPPALPEPQPAPVFAETVAAPAPVVPEDAPVPAAEADPVVAEAIQTLIEPAVQPSPRPQSPAEVPVAVEAPVVPAVAPVSPKLPTRFEAPVETASYVTISETVRHAAEEVRSANGKSRSVVQLGAYSSPQRVMVAWDRLTKEYPALAKYTPMRARFDGPKGTVWRLSIKGFSSQSEAIERCELLQGRGGNCFVRRIAGDRPVQFASR